MADHNELGKIGEQIAANYLLGRGYDILERNFYFDKAEIDIIALKGKTLAIVEVKTRNTDLFGNPQDFITKRKIKHLVKAANEFVISNDLDIEVRFDVIAVLKNESKEQVEHFKDAFYHF
jgi:putative endonuclease